MTEREEAAIRSDEFARVRALVQAKARRLRELGRARDADRWRAVDTWLRGEAPDRPPKASTTPE